MRKHIVVIGSGLAGSLVANALAEKARVTVLEIGPRDSIVHPPITFQGRGFAGVKTFCYGAGGTTNLWHNGLIPIDPADVASETFRAVLVTARPYMDAAAERLFFRGRPYSIAYGEALEQQRALTSQIVRATAGVDCLLYPRRFAPLRPASAAAAKYGVRDVRFTMRGHRMTAVAFADDSGRAELAADAVVICAGALGSPRVVKAMLEAAGKDTEVGRGLIDHPLAFVGKARVRKPYRDLFRTVSLDAKGTFDSCTAVKVKSSCGRYSAFAFFRPAITMSNSLALYKYKSALGASSGVERIRHALSYRILHPDILAEIVSHLSGKQIPSDVYNILVYFEQRRGQNSVAYDGDRLLVDWRITDEELMAYNDVLRTLQRVLAPLTEDLTVEIPLSDEWLWSGAHYAGTVSLGHADTAVVDVDLRMRCCENAFVCDGSVIQEHSAANTGLTIGQLAMRVADTVLAA